MIDAAVQQHIDEATRRLREALNPVAIYLYGSYAYGEPHEDSDLDLLVVVEESSLDFIRRSVVGYRALRGLAMPKDVQVYTREEFEKRAALAVSFERTVRNKGRLLYAA